MSESIEDTIRKRLEGISNKRARIVLEHILEHGQITTEELEKTYGYSHPPRAARDVREAGIPLETFRVKSSDGRTIAAYRFGDSTKIRKGRFQGRRAFSKQMKSSLYEAAQGKCAICAGEFHTRYLQIDHRIPYEVAGDDESIDRNLEEYMLLCGSCNRAKSWSCEHCQNWLNDKNPQLCLACYWAKPDNYYHIALREVRRVDVLWSEDEVQTYEKLKNAAHAARYPIPEYVKKLLANHFEEEIG